jgi:hypothetical protein
MPFASYATSGFQMPSGPDWTQFALQANQMISHGTDLMAQQSQNLVESIDKTTQQVSRIIKEHSPEARLMKELKVEALKAQKSMFAEYKAMSPAQRAATFEFKNGMLAYKDKYKGIAEAQRYYNSVRQGQVLDKRLAGTAGDPVVAHQRATSQRYRDQYGNKTPATIKPIPITPVDVSSEVLSGGTNDEGEDKSHTTGSIEDTGDTDTEDAADAADAADEAESPEGANTEPETYI